MVTVDGFFAGEGGDISWHNVDAEFNEFAINQLEKEVGTIMFGRVTYKMMSSYWPSDQVVKDDPVVAGLMNNASKVVFSKSLQKAEWNNTVLMNAVDKNQLVKLKQEASKDLFIFGSGKLVQEFAGLGLIDEYRLMLNPVILGKGKPLFNNPLKLKLLKSREFKNGNVLLCYQS